ncbi:TadG [Aliivibrio fischeri]|uniref:TadG n=1 Tax=Aliivibrio fischeri TaxID=668 RepID=UPI00084C46E8|nr:TadG [Aliivibrio fischeri]OED58178.1 TadG [Aliivibrio fischeri]
MKSKDNQQGHASILFAMMIPVLFGIFILASDGARAIQKKARLEDASEAAVLAISAHNDYQQKIDSSGIPSDRNKEIVSDYIAAYVNDIENIENIEVYKRSCEDIEECKMGLLKGESRFFEHEIKIQTKHNSWFPGDSVTIGMGTDFSVTGTSSARKYQSEAVDVMFAADFSGSMDDHWTGGSKKKYKDLIDIIKNISDELVKYNNLTHHDDDNTIGVSAYNLYTYSQYSGYSSWGDDWCYLDQAETEGKFWGGGGISYKDTVENLWLEKSKDYCKNYRSGQFNDLALTTDFDLFNAKIEKFKPKGGTASYSALIRAAQLLRFGVNSRRLLIVLSDGDDNDDKLAIGLVNSGMCDEIRVGLESDKTLDNRPIKAQLAVIGFDYDPFENKALKKCVGDENVYKAENVNDIQNKILELISEEVGHLK